MICNIEEAKRIFAKIQDGGTLTDDERKCLIQVAKKAIKKLPEMPGSWLLALLVTTVSTWTTQGLINEVLEELFDGD